MSRTNFQKDRIKKAAQFEADLSKRIKSLRGALLQEVNNYLSTSIKPDTNGRVQMTISNVRAANGVAGIVQGLIKVKGGGIVRWLLRRLSQLFGINSNYFRSFQEYPKSKDEKALRLLMLRLGYDNVNNRLVKGGYLASVFNMQGVISSIARDIQQSLAARVSLAAFRKLFRDRFTAAGYVERWFNRFTRDVFHQFDASSQAVLADDLGLRHFQYAGTAIKTTRCFCERRMNQIYTTQFANEWNNDKWRGKIENGNFFVDRGGYNCRHHLSYITKTRAERMANQRQVKINSFNEIGCNENKE